MHFRKVPIAVSPPSSRLKSPRILRPKYSPRSTGFQCMDSPHLESPASETSNNTQTSYCPNCLRATLQYIVQCLDLLKGDEQMQNLTDSPPNCQTTRQRHVIDNTEKKIYEAKVSKYIKAESRLFRFYTISCSYIEVEIV